MDSIIKTPAASPIFTAREYKDTLTGTLVDLFWTLVSKILFVSCRSRTDLNTALDFLTTQVCNTDRDDHKKLSHTIRYIRAAQGMDLTL